MKNKKKLGSWIGSILSVGLSLLMIVALVVTSMYETLISNVLNASTTKIENKVEAIYTSDFDSYEDSYKAAGKLGKQIVAEGIVLLQNNEDVLPLDASIKRISVFGQDSVDFVYGGTGSGAVNSKTAITLKDALEKAGYEVNATLWNFYLSGEGSQYRKSYKNVTGDGAFSVNEVPLNVYTQKVKDSYAGFNDAAIVVIGRSGGESADLPTEVLPTGVRYLQLDPNEVDTIKMATENFEHVIVVINASNPIELGFLEELDVDAALWVGAVGQTGMDAIGEVLNGTVNPSGRLVDTYAYDSTNAPTFANLGNYSVVGNGVSTQNRNDKYLVYSEGIYVGYRYYETRYEDTILGNTQGFDYAKQVQFPFGFGLSYTEFTIDGFSVVENEDDFTIELNVTNTGEVAGKEVVQIYMQSPYTEYDRQNKIEKASVELVGFAKTQILEPNTSEKVSITVDKEWMKVYDANGAKTYVLDAGDYYFSYGRDAHDAVNNILAAKGYGVKDGLTAEGQAEFTYKHTLDVLDATTYATSLATNKPITNQFDDVDIRYYDDNFVYLSRDNWIGTWPKAYQNGTWNAPKQFLDDTAFYRGDGVVESNVSMPLFDQKPAEHVYLYDLVGKSYDDPAWDTLISELSVSNVTRLIRMGGYATVSIDVIGLPGTTAKDGPAGFSSSLIPGRSGMAYPAQIVMASTWNKELMENLGKMIGEDSLALEITGWYAPGINIHRSPYSGRNFEYFSEDSFLSGVLAANEIKGAVSKGVMAYMKHFALNDQETNRTGGSVFANEQSIREIYLRPFEFAVREGGATAAMASMNRIGARWSGAHPGLMNETLRNEWGFNGVVITDQASVSAMLYQDMISGLYAGTDLWLNTNNTLWSLDEYTSNPTVLTHAQTAAKNILYSVANSNAMNGISPDTRIITIMPWWQKTLWGASIVVWLGSLFSLFWLNKNRFKKVKA